MKKLVKDEQTQAKLLEVCKVDSANSYLPAPLVLKEKVRVHKDQSNISNPEQFIRVIHNKGKSESVFYRNQFKVLC